MVGFQRTIRRSLKKSPGMFFGSGEHPTLLRTKPKRIWKWVSRTYGIQETAGTKVIECPTMGFQGHQSPDREPCFPFLPLLKGITWSQILHVFLILFNPISNNGLRQAAASRLRGGSLWINPKPKRAFCKEPKPVIPWLGNF